MREIKFRAWNKYGMTDAFTLKEISEKPPVKGQKHLEVKWEEDTVFMQFTGLLDKNGIEIYEGDVCTAYQKLYVAPSPLTVKVVFNSEKARFEPQQYWRGDHAYKSFINVWDSYDFEVIGNIYENHELLK